MNSLILFGIICIAIAIAISIDIASYNKGWDDCFDTIMKVKHTVNDISVVHGHWEITPIPILLRNNTTRTYYFKCNKCSFTSWNKNNYCSHCGAKMDFNDSNVLNALDQKEVNANALDEVTE